MIPEWRLDELRKGIEDINKRAVWFSSNLPRVGYLTSDQYGDALVLDELRVGDTVTVKATVKEHGEYKGVKQTVLTRCVANRFNPDTKEAKKVLRAIKKNGRVFDTQDAWERHLNSKRHETEEEKAVANG